MGTSNFRSVGLCALAALLAPSAVRAAEVRSQRLPAAWLSADVVKTVLDQCAYEVATRLDLTSEQLARIRTRLQREVGAWFRADDRWRLAAEYLLLRQGWGLNPAGVADWARRAEPLLPDVIRLALDCREELLAELTAEQRVRFDEATAPLGRQLVELAVRMAAWTRGEFTAREFGRERIALPPELEPVPDPFGRDWRRYVQEFIRQYGLTADQQEVAWRFLLRAEEQRERYLARTAGKWAEATQKMTQARTEAERAEALALQSRLTKPLDRMFEALRERVETLPTRRQRAADAAAATSPTAEAG